jgi:oligoribonuclease (3'-5' exoribonuclease)
MTNTIFMWIDFETTGLIEPAEPWPLIIEAGWAFTTDQLEPVGPARQRFVGDDVFDPWAFAHPAALDMHTRSGLVAEWRAWREVKEAHGQSVGNLHEVDAAMCVDLEAVKRSCGADRVALAGSGIGPFDVPLARQYLPGLMRAVYYRPFDISPIRTLASLLKPPVVSPWKDTDRPHRADQDVDWSIREGRWWLDWAKSCTAATA